MIATTSSKLPPTTGQRLKIRGGVGRKKPNGSDLRDLIAKAQKKLEEKRKTDHRREAIARKRIVARLAMNQMVATVDFNLHLDYYKELEQLGYTFMRDEVSCLNTFNQWCRSHYDSGVNSILEKNETPWCDEDSTRKKQQKSTNDKSMEHSVQRTKNGESAESSNQRPRKRQNSTSVIS